MDLNRLFDLRGRTAFVTGASSGIGLHVAGLLAGAGAAVALAARRTGRIAQAAAGLQQRGLRACSVELDVTQPDSAARAFDQAQLELGGPVDLLVNNAGVMLAEKFLTQSAVDVQRVFDTNLMGAFLVAQEAARRMAARGSGCIVHVASTAGLRAGSHMASYGASKAALIHLGSIMALELAGKGVRVNTLCPGNIDTEMQAPLADKGFDQAMIKRTPMRRFGTVDDLDGAVLLLCSDAGRYMTGSVLTVDGGQSLSWM